MKNLMLFGIPALILAVLVFLGYVMYRGQKMQTSLNCASGACPSELRQTDDGGQYTYTVGSTFTVLLDSNLNPPSSLTCTPQGIIRPVPSTSAPVAPPQYVTRFQALSPGTCFLKGSDFSASITVTAAH